jgi:hypothetical protein
MKKQTIIGTALLFVAVVLAFVYVRYGRVSTTTVKEPVNTQYTVTLDPQSVGIGSAAPEPGAQTGDLQAEADAARELQ